MYDNHLLTLDVYATRKTARTNGSSTEVNSINNVVANLNSGLSIESINSSGGGRAGGGGGRRRQLPQIPLDKQRENREKVANDLVEKARKIKMDMKNSGVNGDGTSDSETMSQFVSNTNNNNNSNNSLIATKTTSNTINKPSFMPIHDSDSNHDKLSDNVNLINGNVTTIPNKPISQRINPNYSKNSNEDLYISNINQPNKSNNINSINNSNQNKNVKLIHDETNSFRKLSMDESLYIEKEPPIKPINNQNIYNNNNKNENVNMSSEFLSNNNKVKNMISKPNHTTSNTNIIDSENEYDDLFKSNVPNQNMISQTNKKLIQNKSTPQLWNLDKNLDSLEDSPYINSSNKNKPVVHHQVHQKSISQDEDLYIKGSPMNINNNQKSNNTSMSPPPIRPNNNHSNNPMVGEMIQSPSQTFGSSAYNNNTNNTSMLPPRLSGGPEKLFSTRLLNQKSAANTIITNNTSTQNINNSNEMPLYTSSSLGPNNKDNLQQSISSPPISTQVNHHKKFPNDVDSDGSEHSQLSNTSKLSSNSVISAQSELNNNFKGANNKNSNTNTNKMISGLTVSDGNRYVTSVATNANNNTTITTTTTLLNNNNNIENSNDPSLMFDSNKNQQLFQQKLPPNFIPGYNNISSNAFNYNSTQPPATTATTPGASSTSKINNLNSIEKADGTLSDSALTNSVTNQQENSQNANNNKKRRPSMAKALVILGLSKKSNSASNLSSKRFGFARSEEYGVVPELRSRNSSPAGGDSSDGEQKPKPSRLWSGALKLPHELPFNEFVERLGPGQKVSRQVLGLPCLGHIQMTLFIEKQKMNVEIIQVKNLKLKTGHRVLPSKLFFLI